MVKCYEECLRRKDHGSQIRASAVALNEQFGFGADRIARYRDAFEKTIIEYGALMDSADAEYADGKLEERYQQIMGGGAIE